MQKHKTQTLHSNTVPHTHNMPLGPDRPIVHTGYASTSYKQHTPPSLYQMIPWLSELVGCSDSCLICPHTSWSDAWIKNSCLYWSSESWYLPLKQWLCQRLLWCTLALPVIFFLTSGPKSLEPVVTRSSLQISFTKEPSLGRDLLML